MRLILFCLTLLVTASPCVSQEAPGLAAPADLRASGLLGHILPRFSLKTGVRVIADPDGAMVLAGAPPGTPVFARADTIYHLRIGEDPRQQRFQDWLLSDIGKRTVEQFRPATGAPFSARFEVKTAAKLPRFTGNAARGAELSRRHCGRCHMVNEKTRMTTIGSTPSFALMRGFPDWSNRFEAFYALNPHPAFTIVAEVTEPFDETRPPPIAPLELSLQDIEAILAFVRTIEPADLGSPLKVQ